MICCLIYHCRDQFDLIVCLKNVDPDQLVSQLICFYTLFSRGHRILRKKLRILHLYDWMRGIFLHRTFVCFTTGIWKKTPGDVVR